MFGSLFESKGVKRTVSVLLFLVGQAGAVIPAVAPWVPIINNMAVFFGMTGIGHAVLASNLKK